MARYAALSDIHGNLARHTAVKVYMSDMKSSRYSWRFALGDIIDYGMQSKRSGAIY